MIYYIDDFMTKMVKAHNTVTSDQRKAINMVKNVIETFQPQDEDILFFLKSGCEVGLDNPKKFKGLIMACIDKVQVNHDLMIQSFNQRKKSHGKQISS